MSHPSKAKGYRGEIEARDELRDCVELQRLDRTGSVAYHLDAADLVQEGVGEPVRIVATKDDRQPFLYTLTAPDLHRLIYVMDPTTLPVVVQVKKRKTTWVGSLYRALKEATK